MKSGRILSEQTRRQRGYGHGERGQILLIAAFAMIDVLGISALAVDVGFFFQTKRDLQNSADAMALAAAAGQPDNSTSNLLASQWATKNDVDASEIIDIAYGSTCSGVVEPHTVTVRLERNQPTFFARVLGITDGDVPVCATAGRYELGGAFGVSPWAVEDDCVWGPDGAPGGGDDPFTAGEIITLKYDADNTGEDCDASTGNFSPLAIDTTGSGSGCDDSATEAARKYAEAICYGSATALCTQAAIDESCTSTVDTQTGNLIGKTRDSVFYLFEHAEPGCLVWDDFVDETTDPWQMDGECKPWLEGNNPISIVRLIPIVDGLWTGGTGHHTVDVVVFLLVVLEPIPEPVSQWCKGNDCDVIARIFDNNTFPSAYRAPLGYDSNLTFVTLVE